MSFILRQDEKLIKQVRRHWVFIFPYYAGSLIVLLLLLLIYQLWGWTMWGYWWWFYLACACCGVIMVLYKTFIWKRNLLVLTNQRIVEVQQHGFFSSNVMELLYRDVLEISYVVKGMRAVIYGFGHIKMRTASNNEVIIQNVPNPDKIVEIINKIR